MAPFLAALAIIVIVVIAIWLINVFEGDRTPEDQRVGTAAVGQNDALQRGNFADFGTYTCVKVRGVGSRCACASTRFSGQTRRPVRRRRHRREDRR